MAFAAQVSLQQILNQLNVFSNQYGLDGLNSDIRSIRDELCLIRAFLIKKAPAGKFLTEIREALWRAEDFLESHMENLNHFVFSESESLEVYESCLRLTEGRNEVMREMKSITKKIKNWNDEVNVSHGEGTSSSRCTNDVPKLKNKMVGLEEELKRVEDAILRKCEDGNNPLRATVIWGMGGKGKTSLALSLYNDPDVQHHFVIHAWVNVSHEQCVRDILINLFDALQVFGQGKGIKESELLREECDESIASRVRSLLMLGRYLVVFDGLCEIVNKTWSYICGSVLPHTKDGSRIIFTTRQCFPPTIFERFDYHQKLFLGDRNGWHLFCEQVFGEQECTPRLDSIGKRIVENCQGLPLAIIATGRYLAKATQTPEYWCKVAESGNLELSNSDEIADMLKLLSPSYELLPQRLKACFLYLGAFPQRYRHPVSRLMILWMAEGFIELGPSMSLWKAACRHITQLAVRSLIFLENTILDVGFGICMVHNAHWLLCCREAKKDKFFHVVDKYNDLEDITRSSSRRLVIRKSVVLAFIDACSLVHSVSTTRSLLCTGPYSPYAIRIELLLHFRMLRVLSALSIRFHEFPAEIYRLSLLRYLALTYNGGELPPGMSKLQNLQALIVHLHHVLRSAQGTPSYLPMEIWRMRELRHLEFMGKDLPVPDHRESNAFLPQLSTLLYVSHHSCTEEVLGRIPNLTKLRIQVDQAPLDPAALFHLFGRLNLLKCLNSLKFKISNPYFDSCHLVVPMYKNVSRSMDDLTELTLSGCGFPWEEIEMISHLPSLKVLKLRCHAFRGPKWELTNKGFKRLTYLLLEDLDLVYLTAKSSEFLPCLERLVIRNCYKLREMTPGFGLCSRLHILEVDDCSPIMFGWAAIIQKEHNRTGQLELRFHCSWTNRYFTFSSYQVLSEWLESEVLLESIFFKIKNIVIHNP